MDSSTLTSETSENVFPFVFNSPFVSFVVFMWSVGNQISNKISTRVKPSNPERSTTCSVMIDNAS